MKHFYAVLSLFACTVFYGQIVNIPDANFKNALVNTNCVIDLEGNPAGDVDINDDGEIDLAEAAAVTGLNVSSMNIASLEGINSFTNLVVLNCSYNQLTSLSIVSTTFANYIDCSHNQLTVFSADLAATEIDESIINCSYNALTSFFLSGAYFSYVNIAHNALTSVSLSAGSIISMDASFNSFTAFFGGVGSYTDGQLNLTDCPNLTYCEVGGAHVNLENNPQLQAAKLSSSGMYEVHNNPLLQSVDIKDGYAPYIDPETSSDFFLSDNPSLQFVCVDDLGNWYQESDTFYMSETDNVHTDPGVNITYYCDLTPGGGFNTISGTVHYDCPGNNVALSGSDLALNLDSGANGSVEASVSPNDSGQFVIYGNGSGTVTPTTGNNYWTFTPANASYSFSGTGNTQTADFCLGANGVHPDLEVSVIPVVPARPGFDAVYEIHYKNKGTETASGSVSFNFDDNLSDAISSVPAADLQNTGSLSWNFSGLMPFEVREITVTLNVNSPVETPAVNVGDVLALTASVDSGSDETPGDNVFSYPQTVVGSIDPNDKEVSRTAISTSELDDYLYYTVHFQNTGTFPASQAVIRDLLSDKLDVSSLQLVGASHPCRMQLTKKTSDMAADKLEFFFEGIDLPDAASNEPASHGFVAYRVKPKNNLATGDVISNNAGIYFEYNSPVMTNTVTTTVTALANASFASGTFSIFPNPTAGNVTIKMAGIANVSKVSVFNTLGQIVQIFKPAFENGEMTIDVSALHSGTYLLKLDSVSGTSTKKLIKW